MDKKPDKEIKKFIDKLDKEFKPDKIILFGSRAEGKERGRPVLVDERCGLADG